MAELPYMQFYPSDWMADCQVLSLAGRGAWQTIICKAWHPSTRGVVTLKLPALARLFGATVEQTERVIAEIEETGVADVLHEGDTVRITSRRIVREWEKRTQERQALSEGGKLGAERRWGKNGQKNSPPDSPPNREPNSPPIGQATSRPMAIQKLEARDQKLEREEAREPVPILPDPENPLPRTNHMAEPFKAKLRPSEEFCAVWRQWLLHLEERNKPMSNQQKDSVLMECAKKGAERSAEILRHSILKGALNPIWDAPKSKATVKSSAGSPEQDPEGFKRWLSEAYPEAEPLPFAECPDSVQWEFKQSRKGQNR